jgi:type 1 glutamine amidotransferase
MPRARQVLRWVAWFCGLVLAAGAWPLAAQADDTRPQNSPAEAGAAQKTLLLLGQGPDGHPPQTHEYLAGLKIIAHLLQQAEGLKVEIVKADDPWSEGPQRLKAADGAVLFLAQGAKWIHSDPRRQDAFVELAARGGGLIALHWAMGTREADPIEPFLKLLGGCHGGPDRKFQIVEAEASPTDHAIASGLEPFRVRDEFYYRLKFPQPADRIAPVLRATIDGRPETVAWAFERPDGGRSFGFSGLHFHENWGRPEYRRLVAQGVLWSMKQPIPAKGVNVDLPEELLKLPAPPAE